MSRKKREWHPGETYHVMSRGNRRGILYKDEADYIRFLQCIEETNARYDFKILSICLMTNHFHMIIETADMELWKIMQKVLHPYSMDFNHKYGYTGHVFESRYVSCCIKDDVYLLEASRYIHLNPVKAMMVRGPLDYEYSSYGSFVGREDKDKNSKRVTEMINGIVNTDRILRCFRDSSREQYRMFVEGKISHSEQEMLIQTDIKENDLWLPW